MSLLHSCSLFYVIKRLILYVVFLLIFEQTPASKNDRITHSNTQSYSNNDDDDDDEKGDNDGWDDDDDDNWGSIEEKSTQSVCIVAIVFIKYYY